MYPWYGKKNDIPARNVVERNVVEHNVEERNVEGIHFGRFKQWKMKKSIV